MGNTLRIVQSGALRLDHPLQADLTGLPLPQQSNVVNARYFAGQTVFQTALEMDADLLILAGPVFDQTEDLRSRWWLIREVQNLASAGTVVVLAKSDHHFAWPSEVPFPENLRIVANRQAVGFRIGAHNTPIGIGWAESDAIEFHEVPSTLEIGFIRSEAGPSAIRYTSASATETLVVHPVQCSGLQDAAPALTQIISFEPDRDFQITSRPTGHVAFRRVQISASQLNRREQAIDTLTRQVQEQLTLDSPTEVFTLLELNVVLSPEERQDWSAQEWLPLLREACSRSSPLNWWPISLSAIPTEDNGAVSYAIRTALKELQLLDSTDIQSLAEQAGRRLDLSTVDHLRQRVSRMIPSALYESNGRA